MGGTARTGKDERFTNVKTKIYRGRFACDLAQNIEDLLSTRTHTGPPDTEIPGTNLLNAFILRAFKDQEVIHDPQVCGALHRLTAATAGAEGV